MITVKLTQQKEVKKVEWYEGITVKDILEDSKWTSNSVQTFVDGIPVNEDKKLEDNSELVLVPIVGGG
ncbi:hypothetical protein AKJ52_01615 [candidate division MSBL1 archaeon SCGC-AAA382C18]|uniref:Thiamine biosynthesis protein ThiS n=1 Tax=candidate division MSBL1 archaeon SCGC-AAA382C18 TaxID=1698281 RepID=A0A133VK22_9EURY|nr:hypothetical protein AKJ52_01615 [candidate division MSBL1 archaeon SCGC-AAA382C18]